MVQNQEGCDLPFQEDGELLALVAWRRVVMSHVDIYCCNACHAQVHHQATVQDMTARRVVFE